MYDCHFSILPNAIAVFLTRGCRHIQLRTRSPGTGKYNCQHNINFVYTIKHACTCMFAVSLFYRVLHVSMFFSLKTGHEVSI